MSAQVVTAPDGRVYVVDGHPDTGYQVRPVGPAVAHYDRKYHAVAAVDSGAVQAIEDGARG